MTLIVFGILAAQVVQAHDHHGEPCHTPYDDPDDCRHPCDHIFCDCSSACVTRCKFEEEDEKAKCRSRCSMTCFRENSECINKCQED